jgi:cytochrome c peroxidase
MKQKKLVLGTMLLVVFWAGAATAGESSVELGQQLFNDPKLGGGTSGKSCNSCHAGGQGMEKAGKRADLIAVINQCIVGPMKGQKIDGRTKEMRSLKMYIESLAK